MKNRGKVFTAIMVALAFAFAPVLEAALRKSAPLLDRRNDGMPVFLASEITAPQCTTFFMLARSELAVAKLCDPSQAGFIQRRFPNLPCSRFAQIGRA